MNVISTIDKLQKKCIHLAGESVSFYVYFWGAHSNHQDNPLHSHSFFEICYVLGGTGFYVEDRKSYPLQKGVFLCTKPRKLHRIQGGEKLSLFWVGFEVDQSSSTEQGTCMFEKLAETKKNIIQSTEDSPSSLLFTTLIKHGSIACSSELLTSLSHSFFLSLQALFCGVDDDEKKEVINIETRGKLLLKQAQQFIRDNLNRPLSIKDVAQYLAVSPRHLSRLFIQEIGISYTSFIRQERISASAERLRMTDQDIKTISEEYCFSSVHYFTRVFQEETGSTPGKYRKEMGI